MQQLFRDPDARLVTLTGPAGVGKTSLALHIAPRLAITTYFVPLASIVDPDMVVPAVARALGLSRIGRRRLLARVMDHLRPRELLLVLDNFEQVAGAAPQLAELLAACPRLKLLVTSRAVLRIRGEQEFEVATLAVPDVHRTHDPDELLSYPSVALFVRCAQAVKPDFRLSVTGAHAVGHICAQLDGLPLAIELAAARAKLLSPEAILDRIEHPLDWLTGGARDLPVRQRTLRDAIGWSYALLDPNEQRLFRRLAVFSGGCTLDAAASLDAVLRSLGTPGDVPSGPALPSPVAPELADTLESLIDKSLLRQAEVANGEPRLLMLETIHEYALEQLAFSDEATAVRRAHLSVYLALAERAESHLVTSEQSAWLDRLEAEHGNLQTALEWALDVGDVDAALRLGSSLWRFWMLRGYLSDGRNWLDRALAAVKCADPSVQARGLTSAGLLAFYQGDYARASSLCAESLALFRRLHDPRGMATALMALAHVAQVLGDFGTAQARYCESLSILGRIGDAPATTQPTERFEVLEGWLQSGNVPARELSRVSLAAFRELGPGHGVADLLHGLGHVLRNQGDLEPARSLYEEGLALYLELGDSWGIARSHYNLGLVALAQGDRHRARLRHQQSLEIFCDLGDRWFTSLVLEGLAAVSAGEHRPQEAARLFGAAEALRERICVPLPASLREAHKRHVGTVRSGLDDESFLVAWTEGRSIALMGDTPGVLREFAAESHELRAPESVEHGPFVGLSERETEVLRLVATGMTNAEVAARLVISPLTVNAHVRSIFRKLGVRTRSGATRHAVRHGLA
jgi:predicted ATPase/DNA-binding CsgD family transcriptional regulator